MRYLTVFITILGLDLGIKNHIEDHLEEKEQRSKCGGFLLIQKYHNKGAAMNFLEKRPGLVRRASGAVLLMLAALWFLSRKKNPCLMLGLSLAIGGGASNLYDRIRKGYVMDYLSFCTPWKWLNQIVFNISDFCVIFGSLLVIIHGWLSCPGKRR